jgi:hypothetical protein
MNRIKNCSYNELREKFEICRQDWMPTTLLLFSGDDPNKKIYDARLSLNLVDFFLGKSPTNRICKRVNCFDINLNHTHSKPEGEEDYRKRIIILLEESKEFNEGEVIARPEYRDRYQKEVDKISRLLDLWKGANSFKEQVAKLTQYLEEGETRYFPKQGVLLAVEEICVKFLENNEDNEKPQEEKQPKNFDLIRKIFSSPWTWIFLFIFLFLVIAFFVKKNMIR